MARNLRSSSRKETVLVTGGSGFVGGNLALALVRCGYRVRVHHRPGDDTRLIEGAPVTRSEGDICDRESLLRAMEGCAGVFHTAGNVSFRKRDRAVQRRVNVEGTRTVIEACRRAGVRRLVHTSTVNTLGVAGPGEAPADESSTFDPVVSRFHYAVTKKEAEDLALAANDSGLEVVAVNPGTVFGPGDVNLNAGSYILAAARLPVLVCPPGGTNCVHVDTVVEGHIRAFERGRPGERIILGGENLTYRRMFEIILDVLRRARPVIQLPEKLGVAAAACLEAFSSLTGIDTRLSAEAARAGSLRLFYSSEKARRDLGIEPLSFRRAVEDAVAWYRRERFL